MHSMLLETNSTTIILLYKALQLFIVPTAKSMDRMILLKRLFSQIGIIFAFPHPISIDILIQAKMLTTCS